MYIVYSTSIRTKSCCCQYGKTAMPKQSLRGLAVQSTGKTSQHLIPNFRPDRTCRKDFSRQHRLTATAKNPDRRVRRYNIAVPAVSRPAALPLPENSSAAWGSLQEALRIHYCNILTGCSLTLRKYPAWTITEPDIVPSNDNKHGPGCQGRRNDILSPADTMGDASFTTASHVRAPFHPPKFPLPFKTLKVTVLR